MLDDGNINSAVAALCPQMIPGERLTREHAIAIFNWNDVHIPGWNSGGPHIGTVAATGVQGAARSASGASAAGKGTGKAKTAAKARPGGAGEKPPPVEGGGGSKDPR